MGVTSALEKSNDCSGPRVDVLVVLETGVKFINYPCSSPVISYLVFDWSTDLSYLILYRVHEGTGDNYYVLSDLTYERPKWTQDTRGNRGNGTCPSVFSERGKSLRDTTIRPVLQPSSPRHSRLNDGLQITTGARQKSPPSLRSSSTFNTATTPQLSRTPTTLRATVEGSFSLGALGYVRESRK